MTNNRSGECFSPNDSIEQSNNIGVASCSSNDSIEQSDNNTDESCSSNDSIDQSGALNDDTNHTRAVDEKIKVKLQCHMCDLRFARADDLKMHVRTVHNKAKSIPLIFP